MQARDILAAQGEEPLEYDYMAVPYSPTENNKLVQLKNVQQFFPLLSQAPNVDQQGLIRKLLELLQMEDILKDEEQLKAEAEMAQAEAQQTQGALQTPGLQPPGQGGGEDTIATGALPEGAEVPIPPLGIGGAGHPAPLPG